MTAETEFLNDREKLLSNLLIAFYALQKKEELSKVRINRLKNMRERLLTKQKRINFRKSFLLALGLTLILTSIYVALDPRFKFLPIFFKSFFGLYAFRGLLFMPVFGHISVSTGLAYSVLLLSWFATNKYLNNSLMPNWKELEENFKDDPEFIQDLQEYWQARRNEKEFMASENFINDTHFIHEAYKESGIVAKLYKLVDTRRADTYKEALNLYVDDSDKLTMQKIEQEKLNSQRYIQEDLQRIERNTKSAAILSALSYYKNSTRD